MVTTAASLFLAVRGRRPSSVPPWVGRHPAWVTGLWFHAEHPGSGSGLRGNPFSSVFGVDDVSLLTAGCSLRASPSTSCFQASAMLASSGRNLGSYPGSSSFASPGVRPGSTGPVTHPVVARSSRTRCVVPFGPPASPLLVVPPKPSGRIVTLSGPPSPTAWLCSRVPGLGTFVPGGARPLRLHLSLGETTS